MFYTVLIDKHFAKSAVLVEKDFAKNAMLYTKDYQKDEIVTCLPVYYAGYL